MVLNSGQWFSLRTIKHLCRSISCPAGTKAALKLSHKWLWKKNKGNHMKMSKNREGKKKRCSAAYGMKRSILWGGGWDWIGGGTGLEWGSGHRVLRTILFAFTGTIPECHLLVSRLPWQARLTAAGTASARLRFPRMITTCAGAQMMTPSKLPLSGSRVRSTFDPVKYLN